MKVELLKSLHDAREAALAVQRFVAGKTFEEYEVDELLRSGVERKFEIVGEALNRVGKKDRKTLLKIREHRSIISFRNILVHGYDSLDHGIVWGIIEEDLGDLLADIEERMRELDP